MQNPRNWWMWLGIAPIADPRNREAVTMPLEKLEHVKAVSDANNVWILLEADKLVFGSIYLDRAVLLVR